MPTFVGTGFLSKNILTGGGSYGINLCVHGDYANAEDIMKVQTSGKTTIEFHHDKAICREDAKEKHSLVDHLEDNHNMSPEDYFRRYGKSATLFGAEVFDEFYSRNIERKGSESYHTYLEIGSITMKAHVGLMARRPTRPAGYKYPTKGQAGLASARIARAIKYGRNIYYYGPPGTGKSDMFRALAHDLNKEFSLYPMREDLDPALYLGQMQVVVDEKTGVNKTEFVQGRLLRDIQGRVGKDGVRRAVLITIDDIDRAPAENNELYRHLLDGAKEIFVPELGESIPVFPGTQICATANSRGRGEQGLCTSVQTIDDSLLDRFDRFVESHFLEPSEEREILEAKYPFLVENAPDAFRIIMKVTESIRHMIQNREVLMNFSHRILMNWAESLEELLQENGCIYRDELVGLAAVDWLERFDPDHRDAVLSRTLNAYVPRDIAKKLTQY